MNGIGRPGGGADILPPVAPARGAVVPALGLRLATGG